MPSAAPIGATSPGGSWSPSTRCTSAPSPAQIPSRTAGRTTQAMRLCMACSGRERSYTRRPMGYLERVFRATEEENRRAILGTLEPRPGGVLLDLGCADGRVTMRIAEGAGVARAVGVELIEPLAEEARGLGVEVVGADLNDRLPF